MVSLLSDSLIPAVKGTVCLNFSTSQSIVDSHSSEYSYFHVQKSTTTRIDNYTKLTAKETNQRYFMRKWPVWFFENLKKHFEISTISDNFYFFQNSVSGLLPLSVRIQRRRRSFIFQATCPRIRLFSSKFRRGFYSNFSNTPLNDKPSTEGVKATEHYSN